MRIAALSTSALFVTVLVSAQGQPIFRRGPEGLLLQGLGSSIGVTLRDDPAGPVVHDVRSDSPASRAGLQPDDVIIEFDGKKVRNGRELRWMIRDTPPGRRVEANVIRDSAMIRLTLVPTTSRSVEEQDDILGARP